MNLLNKRLWNATREGDVEALEELVRMGADVNATNVQRVSSHVFPFDFVGWSALHFAASYGREDCIHRLAALGAAIDSRTPVHGWAPIHLAAADGHALAIDALLALGASVNDGVGFRVSPAAGSRGPTGTAAAAAGNRSVDPPYGSTGGSGGPSFPGAAPLHLAAAHGRIAAVEALLFAGADEAAADAAGRTALDLAREAGHDRVALRLARARRYEEARRARRFRLNVSVRPLPRSSAPLPARPCTPTPPRSRSRSLLHNLAPSLPRSFTRLLRHCLPEPRPQRVGGQW
jgi:ankyrin repeat protein